MIQVAEAVIKSFHFTVRRKEINSYVILLVPVSMGSVSRTFHM